MAMATATVLGIISLAGTAVSAYSQYRAGKAQKQAANNAATEQERAARAGKKVAEANAQLSDYNAQVAELQSEDALDRGHDEESRFRSQVRGAIGAQRAAFAGGNIDVSFGSAVDVQADAAFLGEMDALQIRTNAAREAWGFKVQATNYRMEADIRRREGDNIVAAGVYNAAAMRAQGRAAQTSSLWGAAGTLLGGTASLLQMRYAMKNG